MNIKNEKGFTGADVIVALLIVTVFASIIATLYQNYVMTSRQIERKAEATRYAVECVENIKSNSQEYFSGINENKDEIILCNNETIPNTNYSKSITINDYSTINTTAKSGITKVAYIKISYKFKNEIQYVELKTVISKEGNA